MASREKFGDIDQLRDALRGTALDQASVAVGELVHEARDLLPQIGTLATTTLVGFGLSLPLASAANKEVPQAKTSHPRGTEMIEPAGATLWGLGTAYARQAHITPAAARQDIWLLNNGHDPLMKGRTITMPLPPHVKLIKLKGHSDTFWKIAEHVVGPNPQADANEVKVLERNNGIAPWQTTILPKGFTIVVPNETSSKPHQPTKAKTRTEAVPSNGGAAYLPSKSHPASIGSTPKPSTQTTFVGGAVYVPRRETPKLQVVEPKGKATHTMPPIKELPQRHHHITVTKPMSSNPTAVATPVPATPTTSTASTETAPAPTVISTAPQATGTVSQHPDAPAHHVHHKAKVHVHHPAHHVRHHKHVSTTAEHPVKLHHPIKRHRTVTLARKAIECTTNVNTGHLFGSTRAVKIINYFRICDGITFAGAVGIEANLKHENVTFDPRLIEGGGRSKNPADAGSGGYGIAQWTPGANVTTYAGEYGITAPMYTLRGQLELVSYQLNGHSPTGYPDLMATMRVIKNPAEATYLFDVDFEGPRGGGNLPQRLQNAQTAVQAYQQSRAIVHGNSTHTHHNKRSHHHNHMKHRHHVASPAPEIITTSAPPTPATPAPVTPSAPAAPTPDNAAATPTAPAVTSPDTPPPVTTTPDTAPTTSVVPEPTTPSSPVVVSSQPQPISTAVVSQSTQAGNAAIFFSAEKYNSISYSWGAGHQGGAIWHKENPAIGPQDQADCSGFVDLALYDATRGRVSLTENTYQMLADTINWTRIPYSASDASNVQRGDLILPVINGVPGDHVEVVDQVTSTGVETTGAHTDQTDQADQVGPAFYPYPLDSGDVFLRYKGPGAPLGDTPESPTVAPPPPPVVVNSDPQPVTGNPQSNGNANSNTNDNSQTSSSMNPNT